MAAQSSREQAPTSTPTYSRSVARRGLPGPGGQPGRKWPCPLRVAFAAVSMRPLPGLNRAETALLYRTRPARAALILGHPLAGKRHLLDRLHPEAEPPQGGLEQAAEPHVRRREPLLALQRAQNQADGGRVVHDATPSACAAGWRNLWRSSRGT